MFKTLVMLTHVSGPKNDTELLNSLNVRELYPIFSQRDLDKRQEKLESFG